MKQRIGEIIISNGANIWEHEIFIAKAMANLGYNIRFIPAHNSNRSADAYINGTIFEFKSPEGNTIRAVERNINKAIMHQSRNVIISSHRMKKLQDRSILNFLISNYKRFRGIKRLYFVTRSGKVIDIKEKL